MRRPLSLALIACLIAFPAPAADLTRTDAPQQDEVSLVLPLDINTLHDRLSLLYDSSARDFYEDYPGAIYVLPENVPYARFLSPDALARFHADPIVKSGKFYVFFGAYRNMQSVLNTIDPLSATGSGNPALIRYASLPSADRAYDFYLWSPDVPFWYSEYRYRDRPAPFRSYFIVHLAAVDADHTSVELIEYRPVVRLDGEISVDSHGKLNNTLQPVAPTTSDRVFLLSCVRQFIERNVPGRHWFSCRSE